MKHGCFTLLAALAATCCGCQSTQYNREVLERELRWQEDEIYYLQEKLDESFMRLDACRRENASLKKDLGVSDGKSYDPRKGLPPPPDAPRRGPNNPDLRVPDIQQGTPVQPGDIPFKMGALDSSDERFLPISTRGTTPGGFEMPADQVITQIVLNKMLSGGQNVDGHGGDDGLLVVFEPRNAAGQLVPVAGEVSIVLLDPNIDGDAARVGRWDFLTDEVVTHFRKAGFSRGLYFDLRWPSDPPTRTDMKLFVRFITPEGRKLIAEKDLHLHMTDLTLAGQWAKADADPPRAGDRPAAPSSPPNVARPGAPEWKPYR